MLAALLHITPQHHLLNIPHKLFDDFGVRYTFSTDAPALQKTTLASELQLLLDCGAASPEQLEASFETAADSSFLPDPKKKGRRSRSKSRWAGHVKA